jgi:Arc/MetJ family transcription regulator
MIDIINDLQIQGLIPENFLEYRTEQTYQREEIDFDDDLLSVEQSIAREDAMRDMYDIDEEY